VSGSEAMRERIIDQATQAFLAYGYTVVTTEAIAARLGISKKTLYRYFTSKEELLRSVVEREMGRVEEALDAVLLDPGLRYLDKLGRIIEIISAQIARLGKSFAWDVYRSAPHVWRVVEEFRHRVLFEKVGALIREGADRGFVRPEISFSLVLRLLRAVMENVLHPETMSELELSPEEAYRSLFDILYAGILSDTGRDLFRSVAPGGRESDAAGGDSEEV